MLNAGRIEESGQSASSHKTGQWSGQLFEAEIHRAVIECTARVKEVANRVYSRLRDFGVEQHELVHLGEHILCSSVCGPACTLAGYFLRARGFSAARLYQPNLPPEAHPWRNECYFLGKWRIYGSDHHIIKVTDPNGGPPVLVDPTYRQFIAVRLPGNGDADRLVADVFPEEIAVIRADRLGDKAKEIARRVGMAGLGCSPEIIEGAFRIVWNLEAYCPCTGANETVEQLLESLRQGKIFCVNGSNLIMLNELALLSGLELSQSAKDILHFVPGEGRKPPSLEN